MTTAMTSRDSERVQFPARAAEALAADQAAGKLPPRVLILSGIPGSGKDESGNRKACEIQARAALLDGRDVVVDRCNFDVQQRKHWIDMGKHRGCPVGCIVFRVPLSVCLRRVQGRSDHPTLMSDDVDSVTVVRRIASMFVAPTPAEKIDFCRVVNEYTDMKKVSAELHLF